MTPLLTSFLRKTRSLYILCALCFVALSWLTACHDDGLSSDQRAVRQAAERCYAHLVKGHYDKFVGELAGAELWSADYRSQMEDLVREHVATITRTHGALIQAEAVGDTLTADRAQVFLQITFADNTSEEIGLPMRRIAGKWLME